MDPFSHRAKGSETTEGQPGILRAALRGSCPRCGARTLFEAPARVAIDCSRCDLELGALERGGRFAGLLTALIAVILMMIALGIDMALSPPLWLQALIWAPLTIAGVVCVLRLFKTVLLYAAYEASKTSAE